MKLLFIVLAISMVSAFASAGEFKIYTCEILMKTDSEMLERGWHRSTRDRLSTSGELAEVESVNAIADKLRDVSSLEITKVKDKMNTYILKDTGSGMTSEKLVQVDCVVK